MSEENKVGKWFGAGVRQMQRARILYMVVQPMMGVFQWLTLVFIWISADFGTGIIAMIVLGIGYTIASWRLDKSGFFQMWRAQEVKSKDSTVLDAQMDLQAARYVKFQGYTEDELNEIIARSSAVLGIKEKTTNG